MRSEKWACIAISAMAGKHAVLFCALLCFPCCITTHRCHCKHEGTVAQAQGTLELVVWHSPGDVKVLIPQNFIDCHNLPGFAIQEARPELVAPIGSSIGAICLVRGGIDAGTQVQDVDLQIWQHRCLVSCLLTTTWSRIWLRAWYPYGHPGPISFIACKA